MPSTVNPIIPEIFLGNDWPEVVQLYKVVNGVKIGFNDTDGAAEGYLGATETATGPVDPALVLTVTYIPDDDPSLPAGKWQIELPSSGAVDTALTTHIDQNLFAIVTHPGGARAVAKVVVRRTRYFTVK